MTETVYVQDTLPEFEKACAEATQKELDKTASISKWYVRFAKMERVCHNEKTLSLIRRQKEKMVNMLGRG